MASKRYTVRKSPDVGGWTVSIANDVGGGWTLIVVDTFEQAMIVMRGDMELQQRRWSAATAYIYRTLWAENQVAKNRPIHFGGIN